MAMRYVIGNAMLNWLQQLDERPGGTDQSPSNCQLGCWHPFYALWLEITTEPMAKYGKMAERKVEKAMRERKKGTLKSGRSGKKVTSRKQAIAIGLSEARKRGGKVPAKKTGRKTARKTGRKMARKSSWRLIIFRRSKATTLT